VAPEGILTTSSTDLAAARSGSPGSDAQPVERQERRGVRERPLRGFIGHLKDAGLLLLVAFMIPLAILAIGTPIVLVVRLLAEVARRW
jgi:hypothetical protein